MRKKSQSRRKKWKKETEQLLNSLFYSPVRKKQEWEWTERSAHDLSPRKQGFPISVYSLALFMEVNSVSQLRSWTTELTFFLFSITTSPISSWSFPKDSPPVNTELKQDSFDRFHSFPRVELFKHSFPQLKQDSFSYTYFFLNGSFSSRTAEPLHSNSVSCLRPFHSIVWPSVSVSYSFPNSNQGQAANGFFLFSFLEL